MLKRIYNWQGHRSDYIWLEGEPFHRLRSNLMGAFSTARPELCFSLGLALDKNSLRTRVYGRTGTRRNIVSRARR